MDYPRGNFSNSELIEDWPYRILLICAETASRAIRDRDRLPLWDWALAGLPVLRAAELKQQRKARAKERNSGNLQPETLAAVTLPAVGDGVAALVYLGSVADEGDKGVERALRGEDWFPVEWFEDELLLTGDVGAQAPVCRPPPTSALQ